MFPEIIGQSQSHSQSRVRVDFARMGPESANTGSTLRPCFPYKNTSFDNVALYVTVENLDVWNLENLLFYHFRLFKQ